MSRRQVNDLSDVPEDPQFELPGEEEFHSAAGKPDAVARQESIPDDVSVFIEEMSAAKEYVCTLYRLKDGKKELVFRFRNQIPDNHEVGVMYGPGDYESVFSWTVPNRRTPDTRRIRFSISLDYATPHRLHLESLRQNVSVSTPQNTIHDAIEIFAKMAPLLGNKGGDSGMVEILREQSQANREIFKELRDDMKELQKRTDDRFEKLLTAISTKEAVRPKSILEQLEELKEVKTILSSLGGAEGPADNRPVWLQVVDSIGDKVAPLLDAVAKGGLSGKVAETRVKQGLSTELGRKLLADREQQKLFISNMLSQATTEQAKAGVLKLAQNLHIAVPETV